MALHLTSLEIVAWGKSEIAYLGHISAPVSFSFLKCRIGDKNAKKISSKILKALLFIHSQINKTSF